jgi:transposase InsO family protein
MLAHRESDHLAQRLIRETVVKEGIVRDQLTIHSDRGPWMRSQTVAQLLATLGITQSHSRPHVCDDNPFSESQFKTLKYQPLALPAEVWINPPADRPEPRMLQLPRDTNLVSQLSQTG